MPTERSTDPGVTTGQDILNAYDNNADVLDAAATGLVNLGPGLVSIPKVDGSADTVQVPFSPDGLFNYGKVGDFAPGTLTVNIANPGSSSQRLSTQITWASSVANLTPNITADDRVDLIYVDPADNLVKVAENIKGLYGAILTLGLPLLLCVVPAGEDGTGNTQFCVEPRRLSPDTQQLPLMGADNQGLYAKHTTDGIHEGWIWCPAGKCETVGVEAFQVQWQHHAGNLYVKASLSYDGSIAITLPKNPGQGWWTRLVDVETALGTIQSPEIVLDALGGMDAPLINGGATCTIDPFWRNRIVHFDGTQYIVTP